MDIYNSNIASPKFKHLSNEQIEFIVYEYNQFISSCHGKKRNINKTCFLKKLATNVGCSLATIYNVIKDSTTIQLNSQLVQSIKHFASTAIGRREIRRNKASNHYKLVKAKRFIDLVCNYIKENPYASIDETINYLRLHEPDTIKGMETICTKTFYNYVHQLVIPVKPIDLPRMTRLKKKNHKSYIPKNQKGTSIDERPAHIELRSEFGHWEGDLVTGPRDGQKGALLTLIERKTRFYYTIPIKNKKSKTVLMAFNKLEKLFGESFKTVFKSITFDNGNEFARYRDIEKKPKTKIARTKVYFAHPYRSCERASNENCNGLVRYTIKKGTDINTIERSVIKQMNKRINDKCRRIHNYLSATSLFEVELKNIIQDEFDLYSIY